MKPEKNQPKLNASEEKADKLIQMARSKIKD